MNQDNIEILERYFTNLKNSGVLEEIQDHVLWFGSAELLIREETDDQGKEFITINGKRIDGQSN